MKRLDNAVCMTELRFNPQPLIFTQSCRFDPRPFLTLGANLRKTIPLLGQSQARDVRVSGLFKLTRLFMAAI